MKNKIWIIMGIIIIVIVLIFGAYYLFNRQGNNSCAEAGKYANIPIPQIKGMKCCKSLIKIPPTTSFDDKCIIKSRSEFICSDCGNGKCESWENKCNCPEDCSNNISQYSEITYDDCKAKILEEEIKRVGKLKPAKDELIGAIREDKDSNIWIKSNETNKWDLNGKPVPDSFAWKSNQSIGTLLEDKIVDTFPGGVNYTPDNLDFKECEKYIFSRNAKLEQEFKSIINTEIENQKQRGINISIEDLQVINLVGRIEGIIQLNCPEDLNSSLEDSIISNIANALFKKYPQEFSENSSKDSWVDVHCTYQMGYRIGHGIFDIKI